MHVVSFRFGTLRVSLESTSAARTSYDGVSIVPELAPVEQSSLCNIDHFPRQKTRPEPGFSCHFMGIPIRGEHHDASETDFPVPSVSAVTASAGWNGLAECEGDVSRDD